MCTTVQLTKPDGSTSIDVIDYHKTTCPNSVDYTGDK